MSIPTSEPSPASPHLPRYRLIFLDLDGTLVGREDAVSPRTLAALDGAQAAGCTVVICTARNRHMVEPVAAQWGGHGYAILSNGAIIAEWDTGRVLEKVALEPAVVRSAIDVAHRFGASPLLFGVHVEEDGGERVYTDGRFPPPELYLRRNAYRLLHHKGDIRGDTPLPVGMGVYGPRETVEFLAAAWQDALGSGVAVFAGPDVKYDSWCVFLNSADADKAHAAARVAEMLGVPREQTLAVGDHLNDLGLLRWAGLGVCMGDGHEDARACAAHVTGTLAEDGAAQAIERFVLGDSGRPEIRE